MKESTTRNVLLRSTPSPRSPTPAQPKRSAGADDDWAADDEMAGDDDDDDDARQVRPWN